MAKVLILPKWYPNLNDIQHGIFIKNQAIALAKVMEVGVLFVVTSELVKEDKIEIKREGNYFELTYYFPKKKNRLSSLITYFKSFSKAKKIVDKEWGKPDVLLLYILGRNYKMYKKHYSGIPFVVSEQWSGYLNGGMERYVFFKRKNTLEALAKANRIISVSEPLAKSLSYYSKRKDIEIIPNIVFSGKVQENILSDRIQVLTVADLDDSIKNISGMIEALSQLKSGEKIHFTIIGEGKDEATLRQLAKVKCHSSFTVEFKSRMPHEELLKQYSSCNFYLLNSFNETFCVAAAEAVAAGRPVVSTLCGGPEKYLNTNNSLLTELNQPEKLKDAIQKMIEKLMNGHFLASEVASSTKEKFAAENIAKQYLTILEATINKKNG